jgi:hypothetical protein
MIRKTLRPEGTPHMRQLPAVLLLSALALGLTACQSEAGDPRPAAGRGEAAGPAAVAARPAATGAGNPANPRPALLGDTADLGGRSFGEHLRLSVRGFVDPAIAVAKSGKARPVPPEGKRWVGVETALVNVGGRAYDAAGARAEVVDRDGKRHPAVRSGELTTGFPLEWKRIGPGEEAAGWLVFAVPRDAVVTGFRATLGKSAVDWRLGAHPGG